MIDWLKSLFGKGTLCFEVKGIDRDGHKMEGTVKIPYLGKLETADWDELKEHVILSCRVNEDVKVTEVDYIGRLDEYE